MNIQEHSGRGEVSFTFSPQRGSRETSLGDFETLRQNLRPRLEAIYTKFGFDKVRSPDADFLMKAAQPGTKEWAELRLKTLQGIILQAEEGVENSMVTADRLLKRWEAAQDVRDFYSIST